MDLLSIVIIIDYIDDKETLLLSDLFLTPQTLHSNENGTEAIARVREKSKN